MTEIPERILSQIPRKAESAARICNFVWPSRPLDDCGASYLKENADCVIEIDDGIIIPVYKSDIGVADYQGRRLTEEMYLCARVFGVLRDEFECACKLILAHS